MRIRDKRFYIQIPNCILCFVNKFPCAFVSNSHNLENTAVLIQTPIRNLIVSRQPLEDFIQDQKINKY